MTGVVGRCLVGRQRMHPLPRSSLDATLLPPPLPQQQQQQQQHP
jgi:hypothetical protein